MSGSTEMNSCLYRTSVNHVRILPKRHQFSYSQFMFGLDLNELELLGEKLRFFGNNRKNLFSFYDQDHFHYGKSCLKENIIEYLADRHNLVGIENAFIITQLRMWGFIFNPVSFIFLYGKSNEPMGLIAEVSNTFREMKNYYVAQDRLVKNYYIDSKSKNFYISPFSQLNTTLSFKISSSLDKLHLQVDECSQDSSELFFHSLLSGNKIPLTDKNLLYYTLKYPGNTFLSFAQIHLQALKLFQKKFPWHPKKANPEFQTNIISTYQEPRKEVL